MKIKQILESTRTISCEFFPPRTSEGIPGVFEAVERLKKFNPDFVSVTYGAGGSTRAFTEEITAGLKEQHQLEVMAHLTCVGQTKEELNDVLVRLDELGIENLIALRGDPPRGQEGFVAVEGGFRYAIELIKHIRENFEFGVAAACYPERTVSASGMDWGVLAAAGVLTILPGIVLVWFVRRHLVKGFAMGRV